MTCFISTTDTPHRYVAGTLPESELEDFERHLLECESCRSVVQLGDVLRASLATAVAPRRRFPLRGLGLVGGAIAAVFLGYVVVNRNDGLRDLGRVTPPRFVGTQVRSRTADSVVATIDSAMVAYNRNRYDVAANKLAAASRVDSSPAVAFYLGASLLALDRNRDARDALRRAMQPPGNPYVNDARILIAKTHLRDRDRQAAMKVLSDVPPSSAEFARARALLDSLRGRN